MELREAAGALRDAGYSVIPIEEGEKRPSVKWTPYQERKATDEELDYWFTSCPDRNIAIVTGRISNLIVVDIDPRNGGTVVVDGVHLGRATVVTGGGGYHYYHDYRVEYGSTKPAVRPGVDLKADGGYVLCPPSKTTGEYCWDREEFPPLRRPWEDDLSAVLFDSRRALLTGGAKMDHYLDRGQSPGAFHHLLLPDVAIGGRNNHAAKLAGSLFYKGVAKDRVVSIVRLWNSCLKSPLDDREVIATVESIYDKHTRHQAT